MSSVSGILLFALTLAFSSRGKRPAELGFGRGPPIPDLYASLVDSGQKMTVRAERDLGTRFFHAKNFPTGRRVPDFDNPIVRGRGNPSAVRAVPDVGDPVIMAQRR